MMMIRWWLRNLTIFSMFDVRCLLSQMKGSVHEHVSVNRGVAVLSMPQVWNCRVQHISQPPSADQKLCNNRNPENQTSSASAKRNVRLPGLWPEKKEWNVLGGNLVVIFWVGAWVLGSLNLYSEVLKIGHLWSLCHGHLREVLTFSARSQLWTRRARCHA